MTYRDINIIVLHSHLTTDSYKHSSSFVINIGSTTTVLLTVVALTQIGVAVSVNEMAHV